MYLSTHLAEAPLVGNLCTPKGGEVNVNLGAVACIQTLNNVDYTPSQCIRWHCRLALIQPGVLASQPFCLLPASQSFALWFDVISPPTHLSVGGIVHGPQFLHAEEYTHFASVMLLIKLAPQSLMELGQGPEDGICNPDTGTVATVLAV